MGNKNVRKVSMKYFLKFCVSPGQQYQKEQILPKVGTSTYIGTTFQQIADIRKFDRGLLKDMFLGTPKNMKGIQDKNSVSIAVICFILNLFSGKTEIIWR